MTGVLVLIAVAVLHAQRSPATTGDLEVATSTRLLQRPDAVFDHARTVGAIRHGRLVCFRTAPGREQLVFPQGYSASRELGVRDPSGEIVAIPGSAVGIAFGTAAVGAPAACGPGPARAVTSIQGLGD